MYLDHFKLDQHPFQIAPDYHFLYLSRQHARAMAYMKYTVANQEGFAVISGEIGSGKTTLVQKFLAEVEDSVIVVRINQSLLNAVEFLQTVACGLGIETPKSEKVPLQRELRQELARFRDEDLNVLLLVDDAQNLSDAVLEEIRLLSDSENELGSTLSVILVGQPELEHRLKQHSLRQLDQRIRLRFKLGPLSEEETDLYIQYRMNLAGWEGHALFEPDISYAVYRYTQGVPRLINILCDSVLLNAYVDEEEHLSVKLVESAAHDLEWSTATASPNMSDIPALMAQANQLDRRNSGATIPTPMLLVNTAEGYIDAFALKNPLVRIGRTSSNELQLAYPTVDEFHAAVIKTGNDYFLLDFESKGKTIVDGQPITRQRLKDGTQFEIAPYSIKFVVPKPQEIKHTGDKPKEVTKTSTSEIEKKPTIVATN